MYMTEQEILERLAQGDVDASDLLLEADPRLEKKFNALCKKIAKYLDEVKQYFPDATYYTASGGFHLLLGHSHTISGTPQEQLVALGATDVQIGDGDW